MKKLINVLFVLFLAVGLCGCGSDPKDTKAIITDGENTIEMSANEVEETYRENEMYFDKYLNNRNVKIEGTIKNVIMGLIDGKPYETVEIKLEEGWTIEIAPASHPEVADLRAGDKILVEGKMAPAVCGPSIFDLYRGESSTVYRDDTKITVLK